MLTARGPGARLDWRQPGLFPQNRFAAQTNLVGRLDADYLDGNLIAQFHFRIDVFNAEIGDFRNVQQSFSAREDFDERAEINQPSDDAQVGLPYFSFHHKIFDHSYGALSRIGIGRRDVYFPIVFDVDLHAGLFNDAANDFAAGSNDAADLVFRNLNSDDARSIGEISWREFSRHSAILFRMKSLPSFA